MTTHVRKMDVQRQLKNCPACGYTEGFHVMLARSDEKAKRFRLLLICPMCAVICDAGLHVTTGEGT